MRFSMRLHLDPSDLESWEAVNKDTDRHIAVINDIYSYEKELLLSKSESAERGYLCSAVLIFAQETELGIFATKHMLYALCRQWELIRWQLVDERERQGCSE